MTSGSVEQAQRGIDLASVVEAAKQQRDDESGPQGGLEDQGSADAASVLQGPFLAPGSLTSLERGQLISGIERVLEGLYTHLPLKRARYGFDPIQRLRILRSQLDDLTDDQFHIELADIVTRMRDAHTRYVGPSTLRGKAAVLPFQVERCGGGGSGSYVVTKVSSTLQDPDFRPGVTIEFWNGMPIDVAVQRHGEREVGGRPDSLRAWATQSLTVRSLQYGPPPDEYWVVVGYRTPGAQGQPGTAKELKVDWRVVDPTQVGQPALNTGFAGQGDGDSGEALALDPAAEAVRLAKILMFAPHVAGGGQAHAPELSSKNDEESAATVISTQLPGTLAALRVDAPGGPFGYLRIFAFDVGPRAFIRELLRLIPLLPERGLVIDVRGNPGGYIVAAEAALQLFTPMPIEPTKYSVLATPFTRALADGPLADDLGPWKKSLHDAVRNGELYSQAIPLTPLQTANEIGQQYGGPVLLVADSTTYSSGDLFSAGFVDNNIGPFLCVGSATGAGGANVWDYDNIRAALEASDQPLRTLPDGIGLSFAYRRATRSGPNEGKPIEDVGIEGTPHELTLDDLLHGNRDLLAHCIGELRKLPFSKLNAGIDAANRTVTVETDGLNRLDVFFDGHPGSTHQLTPGVPVIVAYPQGTKQVSLTGFDDDDVRQRRTIRL
ncbi:S41 family peptidase [Geodermatophilus sp. URMC 62]|uniref:S41 family peptidase n=1 Tax=Geodermatophilus sp. URMC 62 TaxID=3423414 RepID=UPI00406CFBF9